MSDVSELLTVAEVAHHVFSGKVSTHSVQRWIAKGVGQPPVKLPRSTPRRDYFVTPEDAQEFITAVNNPDLYRRRTKTSTNNLRTRRLWMWRRESPNK